VDPLKGSIKTSSEKLVIEKIKKIKKLIIFFIVKNPFGLARKIVRKHSSNRHETSPLIKTNGQQSGIFKV
jgi:hypothetical protein